MDNYYESYRYDIEEPIGVEYTYRHRWSEGSADKTHAVLKIIDGRYNCVMSTHKRIDLADKSASRFGRADKDSSIEYIIAKMTREERNKTYFTEEGNYGNVEAKIEIDTSKWNTKMWERVRFGWGQRLEIAKHFDEANHNFRAKNRWEGSSLVSHPDICEYCDLRPSELP